MESRGVIVRHVIVYFLSSLPTFTFRRGQERVLGKAYKLFVTQFTCTHMYKSNKRRRYEDIEITEEGSLPADLRVAFTQNADTRDCNVVSKSREWRGEVQSTFTPFNKVPSSIIPDDIVLSSLCPASLSRISGPDYSRSPQSARRALAVSLASSRKSRN